MHQGHFDQSHINQHSTQPGPGKPLANHYPEAAPDGSKAHSCFATIVKPLGQIYTDQTGRFPTASTNSNNYIKVLYDHDSNAILVMPFKDCTAENVCNAFKLLHAQLCWARLQTHLQQLDNKGSGMLKDFLMNEDIDYQLVPPHVHCCNTAEHAMHMFKNHFIASLCSTNADFTLHLWDRLLPQAELTLNLLHRCQCNPKLSAWAYIHGHSNFNQMPIAPPSPRFLRSHQTRCMW